MVGTERRKLCRERYFRQLQSKRREVVIGGLALKNCYTRRYSREEFDTEIPILLHKVSEAFGTVCLIPKYFEDKESFGDCDILLYNHGNLENIGEVLKREFEPKEIYHNSDVWSFEYKELQVDLILVKPENWVTSNVYFSYNDLGNLMGRIAHKFGLKYGQEGLVYPFRSNGKIHGDIVVSKEPREIFKFLGFSYDRYLEGFNSLDEIFEYVISNRFFNPYMYDMDRLNKINRDRNKKRKTYQEFLKRIEPLKTQQEWQQYYPDKKIYLGLIDYHFQGFLPKYIKLEQEEIRRKAIAEKFNGNLVMERYDLKGKELGVAITEFRKNISDWENYIMTTPQHKIFEDFEHINFPYGVKVDGLGIKSIYKPSDI